MVGNSAEYASLPFKEAIEFFRGKINLPTEKWTDLQKGAHAKAFTVAGAMRDSLLADIRRAVDKGLSEGTSLDEFRRDFDKTVEKHGWQYKGNRKWRTSIIFNTNLKTAYAAGRWKQIQETADFFPYLMFQTMDDAHVRDKHRRYHGVIMHVKSDWWRTFYPPNGWGCRCRVKQLTEREATELLKQLSHTNQPPTEWDEYSDESGVVHKIPAGIDRGWDYNVGEAAYGRILLEHELKRKHKYKQIDNWTPEKYGRPAEIPVDKPIATPLPKLRSMEEIKKAFQKAIGGKEASFINPVNEPVVINSFLVEHFFEKGKRIDGREEYLPFIQEVIEDPFEIWVGFSQSQRDGRYDIRQRYVKKIDIGDGKGLGLVAESVNGVWVGLTFFVADEEGIKNLRVGRLLWGR